METFAGDYAFAHAGINPKRAIDDQQHPTAGSVIVSTSRATDACRGARAHHLRDVEYTPYRIGIDTGAFRTGILTALVLEGDHGIIRASETDGTITTQHAEFR